MTRYSLIRILIEDGYDERLLKGLTNEELKRIFIIHLAVNSTIIF